MNHFIKFLNLLVLLLLGTLFIHSGNYKHISNSILSILPQTEDKLLLQSMDQLQQTKTIFLSVEGIDNKALQQLQTLQEKILHIQGIKLATSKPNELFEAYKKEYPLYYKRLDEKKFESLDVATEVQKLYSLLTNSFFTPHVDLKDPLNLFEFNFSKPSVSLTNNQLSVQQKAYLAIFTVDKEYNSFSKYEELYTALHTIVQPYSDVHLFSTLFYYVENKRAIKRDVNTIIALALGVLLILYILILRNIVLLVQTILALSVSTVVAILCLTFYYKEVSVFVIVFGVSISSVAFVYIFYHFMHGYYFAYNRFNNKFFYGFATTFIAFFIISFIDFDLIKHIALFTLIALTISFLQFAFLFPHLDFKPKKALNIRLPYWGISYKLILIASLAIIVLSFKFIHYDLNLKNLDYDNTSLKQKEEYFNTLLQTPKSANVMLIADSTEELLHHIEQIKKALPLIQTPLNYLFTPEHFKQTNVLLNSPIFAQYKEKLKNSGKQLGFNEQFFAQSYQISTMSPSLNLKMLQDLGFDVVHINEKIVTTLSVSSDEYERIKAFDFIKPLSLNLLFQSALEKIQSQLIFLGQMSLGIIFILLLIITRKKFFQASLFLLFPLAIITLFALTTPLNILHLLMIFVVMSLCIDYAIYTAHHLDTNTKNAIIYSLLSTFAGFGVLIFSQMSALYSIGSIAALAIASLLVLLIFSQRFSQ